MSLRRRIADAWPLSAALIAFAVCLAGLTIAMIGRSDGHFVYPLDDTYIQMAIAKNLSRHGVWGVTRDGFSGAGSSLLWPVLLAMVDRLAGVRDESPLILNVLAAAAVLFLAHRLFRRHIASRVGQVAALVLLIVATPLDTLALVGMEHMIECAAALALAGSAARLCFAATRAEESPWLGLTIVSAGVLVATRYDAASVVVAVLAVLAGKRRWKALGPVAACSVAPGLVYAAVASRHGWPLLPSAILIKQRLTGIDIRSLHGVVDVFGGGALTVLVNSPALFVLVLLAAVLIVTSRHEAAVVERESTLLLIVFVGATLMHVEFGRLGWLYRYESYLVVLGVAADASALAHRLPAAWRRLDTQRHIAAVALGILVVHPLLLRAFLASRDLLQEDEALYVQEYQWGNFFRQYPPEGGLLVTSLGVLSYVTDGPIVDSGGLATLELYPSTRANAFDLGLTYRVAETKGVRVSILGTPESRRISGWRCVAGWTDVPDDLPPETTWVFAADAQAASQVTRDLHAFAARDRDHRLALAFPPPDSADCPEPH